MPYHDLSSQMRYILVDIGFDIQYYWNFVGNTFLVNFRYVLPKLGVMKEVYIL